ncbi:membrane protein insertion efficiency factor YidD [Xylanimonas ulmi]|uniref:Putative membrane protein insertion efficiency factor n=1 Tax=Xylanimonas ulmi TaxID=228973 RepID=A0A4Q7M3X6_9MICO|nr:membrane protein insertion efficiency factor YidD [Xylanibacterium ulmi]RZS62636.1 hypothetical protein EV386_2978 [Xylanibacterium ulmi]
MRIESIRDIPASVLVGMIRVYQVVVSPMTGPTCKYYPSCSHYAVVAIRTHGALRGTGLALWRILRCNPWSLGGVDDVPPSRRTVLPVDGATNTGAQAGVATQTHQH